MNQTQTQLEEEKKMDIDNYSICFFNKITEINSLLMVSKQIQHTSPHSASTYNCKIYNPTYIF